MGSSVLDDAFAHHSWATLRVIDACSALSPEQLATTASGTYGSIIATLRHLVGADAAYLFRLSGEREPRIEDEEEARMDLADLRAATLRHQAAWPRILAEDPDPDAIIVGTTAEGGEYHAPKGIRLAQALHHGTDHRSQICTLLTTLGIEPPAIDVWDYGGDAGRSKDVEPIA